MIVAAVASLGQRLSDSRICSSMGSGRPVGRPSGARQVEINQVRRRRRGDEGQFATERTPWQGDLPGAFRTLRSTIV
jgi:hypothetical protein